MKPFYANPLVFMNKMQASLENNFATFSIPYTEGSGASATVDGWFTYKVNYLDQSSVVLDLNVNCVLWDVFNTGEYYCFPEQIAKVTAVNSVPMTLCVDSLYIGGSLSDSSIQHGQQVLIEIEPSPFEEVYHVALYRYKSFPYDGWTLSVDHIFSMHTPSGDHSQSTLDFDNLLVQEFLSDLKIKGSDFNKLAKKVSAKISEAKVAPSKFLKSSNHLPYVDSEQSTLSKQNIIEESQVSTFSVCSHFTTNTKDVNIVAEDYNYANIPVGVSICTNPFFAKENKLTMCGFGPTNQQSLCPCYAPSVVLKRKYILDSENSISFHLFESNNLQGQKVYNIVKSDNDQVSYTLCPPQDCTEEQVLAEVDSVVKEVLSSFGEQASLNLKIEDAPVQIRKGVQNKGFVLSLV